MTRIENGVAHCPFCDENMPYLVQSKVLGTQGWRMFCGSCGAYGPFDEDIEVAEALWNERDNKRCDICRQICKGGGYVDMNNNVRRCRSCHQKWENGL